MASLTVTHTGLSVTLTVAEKIGARHGNVCVSTDAVAGVHLLANAIDGVGGLRPPGRPIGWPLIRAPHNRGRRVLVVGRRGMPALHITLKGTTLTDLVVAVPDAAAHFEQIRAVLRIRDPHRFTEEDLTFPADATTLAGTLTAPLGYGRGLVLILPGSGEVDRNADHRRFPLGISRDLAHALAAAGFTSLRYDKRGVGVSGGKYLTAGLRDNITDAEAALKALRALDDNAPLFVIGHSEGGIIAEVLAANHAELAGVVLLAAPGSTGEETMRWQASQIAGALPPFAKMVTSLLRVDLVAQQQKTFHKLRATTGDTARLQGKKVNARWLRELLDFDPAQFLGRITSPVLAITGSKDLQVNADDLAIIESSVNGPVEVHRSEDLTHLLRKDPREPSLTAYKRLIKQPTDTTLLTQVTEWITANIPAPPGTQPSPPLA